MRLLVRRGKGKMDKPAPKAEIVITAQTASVALPGNLNFFITATSQDARNWVQDNLSEFGMLHVFCSGRYCLEVNNQVYDPDEVKEYILRMGV